jgi:hypothetical protein
MYEHNSDGICANLPRYLFNFSYFLHKGKGKEKEKEGEIGKNNLLKLPGQWQ